MILASSLCERVSYALETNLIPVVLGLALIALVISSFMDANRAFTVFAWSLLVVFVANALLRALARGLR